MVVFLAVFGLLALAGIVSLFINVERAPEGYQNEEGVHFGSRPSSVSLGEGALSSGHSETDMRTAARHNAGGNSIGSRVFMRGS